MTRTATMAKVLIPVALAAALLAAYFAARSGDAGAAVKRQVVRTAMNQTLHRQVLVNHKGFTLYSLSAEQRGRFICTDAFCRSLWTPLVVPKGTVPTGARHLATIKRPDDHRIQVTYRGRPIYTFNQDRKPGDVKGNGFKDVGIWRPAFPVKASGGDSSPPPTPTRGTTDSDSRVLPSRRSALVLRGRASLRSVRYSEKVYESATSGAR